MRCFRLINFKGGYCSEYFQNRDIDKMFKMSKNFVHIDLKKDLDFLYELEDLQEQIAKNLNAVTKYIEELKEQAEGLNSTELMKLKADSLGVHKGLQYHYKMFDAQAEGYSVNRNFDSPLLYSQITEFNKKLTELENLFNDKLNLGIM